MESSRFRWVECQFDSLKSCRTLNRLKKALQTLPRTLDDTYRRVLENIDPEYVECVQRMLMLLCVLEGTLWSVRKMVDALAVDLKSPPYFDAADQLGGSQDLLDICPSLIIAVPAGIDYRDNSNYKTLHVHRDSNSNTDSNTDINIDTNTDTDSDSRQIDEDSDDSDYRGSGEQEGRNLPDADDMFLRFAHFSVQEYLLSDRTRHEIPQFATAVDGCYALATEVCLRYLFNPDILSTFAMVSVTAKSGNEDFPKMHKLLGQKYPLLFTANYVWPQFAKRCGERADVRTKAVEFYASGFATFAFGWELSLLQEDGRRRSPLEFEKQRRSYRLFTSPLPNLSQITSRNSRPLTDTRKNLDLQTVLAQEAFESQEYIRLAMLHMIYEHLPKVLEDFLDYQVAYLPRLVEYDSEQQGTAAMLYIATVAAATAAEEGSTEWSPEVIIVLLDAGFTNLGKRFATYKPTVIELAAKANSLEFAKRFVEMGESMNSEHTVTRYRPESALLRAVLNHNLEMVEFLVSKGADVNVRGHSGLTILMCAVEVDTPVEIVEYLLRSGRT